MCCMRWNDSSLPLRMKPKLLSAAALLAGLFLGAQSAPAALNPDNFKRIASDVVQLREISRITHTAKSGDAQVRRVTIVALVVAEKESRELKVGDTVVID
jgi:hypothetical protein